MKKHRHATWWTRERCIAALRVFYRTYQEAVTDHVTYGRLTRTYTRSPYQRSYPSMVTLLHHFPSMYVAWEEAGVYIPARKYWSKEWSELEDWYLIEACGLLSREEIARDLNRTPDAVHRRLYDLGINSRTHKGWSEMRVAKAAGISTYIVKGYRERGLLPYVRGTQCVYYDPANLFVIEEIDWSVVSSELEFAARRSLMGRLIKQIQKAVIEPARAAVEG